jgi:hypothetical protein
MGSVTHDNRLALPLALAALLLLGLLQMLGLRPPEPRPANAPADEFSAGRSLAVLEGLLAEGVPHPVGSPANFVVRDRIVAELERLGYGVEVQRAFSCRPGGGVCAPVENLLSRLPGTASPGGRGAVMLATHYDSRGAGPGAADAGAGVAAVLEVARIIRAEGPFRNDVILLLTDGEEVGLLGAEAFVQEHPWARDVAVAINLEARGSSGPSIMFETSQDNHWLVREFARAAARPVASSLTYDVYRLLPNDTDATVFRRAGMAVVNFAFIDALWHYHSELDDLAHLDPRSAQHHGDNALSTLRRFAAIPLEPRPGDAAYTDLFGLTVVHWPAALQLPLAAMLALLVLGAGAALVVRRRATVAGLAWGLLAATLGLVAAVALGFGVGALLSRVTGRPGVLHAHPQPAVVALWLGTLLLVLLAGTLLARRAGALGLLVGAWLVTSLLAVGLAATLPGAAVVLVVPQAIGAVALALAALPAARVRVDVLAIIAALGAGLTLVPLARLLHAAFVLQMPFATTLVVGLAALPLLPLTAGPPATVRPLRVALGVAGGVVLVAVVAALLVPGYSEARPRPVNILYVENPAGGRAAWVVQGFDLQAATLPEVMRGAAEFRDDVPAWLPPVARGPWAPAQALGLPRPDVEVVGEAPMDGGGRLVTLRLRPAAVGNRMVLAVPGAAAARIEGRQVAGLRGAVRGHTTWILHGMPAQGVEVALERPEGTERGAVVYEIAPGLPEAGEALRRARPRTAAPAGDGDATVTTKWLE